MTDFFANVINVTELIQLQNLGISLDDVNWSQVKMISDKWITVRHSNSSPSSPISLSSSMSSSSNTFFPQQPRNSWIDLNCSLDSGFVKLDTTAAITLINPYTKDIRNCQTHFDTKNVQMNPQEDLIALSNDCFLSVYCLVKQTCLFTLPFQSRCHFWTWIDKNCPELAFVTDNEVYHWKLSSEPTFMFRRSEKMKNCQITNYKCDKLDNSWFAVSGLTTDFEGEIIGIVQIYSQIYRQSQCIEAHAINFTTYKFNGNSCATNVLLAAKRPSHSPNQAKVYIIELGPVLNGNSSLISRIESINWSDAPDGRFDFPVAIEGSTEMGLVYIMSKHGSLYVCDMESGAFLCKGIIAPEIVFNCTLDYETQGLIVISRNGQVLSIDLYLPLLIKYVKKVSKNDIAERLQAILDQQSDCDMVTKL